MSSAAGTAGTTSSTQTVSGRVVNGTTGVPIYRALVRLNERAVLSDHEGRFEFPQYSAGSMNRLQGTKPGYYGSLTEPMAPETVFLTADQLTQSIELRLYPEALLTGTVTRPDGTPLPHIAVSARRSTYNDQSHRWIQTGQAMTDSHGNFRLTVPAGDYRLQTAYDPHNGSTSEAVLPIIIPGVSESDTSSWTHVTSGSTEHFELHPQLSRTFGVKVILDSADDRGFPVITARSGNGLTIPVSSSGHPAGPGVMKLELPSGTYTLIANQTIQDQTRYGETTVTVEGHDVENVILHMAAVSPIPVELVIDSDSTSDKTPPTVQQLGLILETTADSEPSEGTVLGLTTGRDQTNSFRPMPGRYRLQAHGAGSAWYVKGASYGTTNLRDKELTVSAGVSNDVIRVTVSNQTGSLRGTTSLNGTPAACWIYLVPIEPGVTSVFSLRSNQGGIYSFPYLPPGSYRAIAFEQRYAANFRAAESLERFTTHVSTVTIGAGDKASLDLNAVPVKEINP